MATLWTGSVTTKAQDNWVNAYVFDAEIIENSTSVENNTSNVTLNLYAKGINGYTYSATGPTAYIDLNGTRKTTPAVSSIGSSRTLIASYTENIEHKDDGTKSISVTFGYSPNSSANYLPKAVSLQANNIALSTIPRKANITSFTVVPKSETSLTFSFTASAICDYAWYSTDNGTNWTGLDITDGTSATFDVTGLSVATSYNCKIKVRRKDSQLTSDPTDAVQKSTYDYPKVTNVGTANLTIGNEQTLTLYNPLGRNVTIRMNKTNASGTQLYSGTTSTAGQSVTFKFTPTASTLYNSIPNDASASCVYSVIYSNISTKTTTGNYTYKIIGTETPTFSDTNWSYSTNLTALTNNHTEVAIDNKSTITVTINTSATSNYGANIDKYVVKWGAGTSTDINSGSTSGSVSTGSGNTLTVTVYDKRGLLKETTKTITNVPYANVIINNDINTQRTNGVDAGTKLNLSGTFYNNKFGTNGVQNALYSAKYYTSTNGTTWSSAYPSDNSMLNAITVSGNNFTLSDFNIHANGSSGGFTVGTRYYIKVEIKDAQGLLGTAVATTTVTDGKIARDVYQDSNGNYHEGINGLANASYAETIYGKLNVIGDYYQNGEPFSGSGSSVIDLTPIGTIIPFTSTTIPSGWLVCDGSAKSRTTYSDLYAVIGTKFGTGDGSTTFNLPNLKGRVVAGIDSSQTEFNALAKTGGSKTTSYTPAGTVGGHTLTKSEMEHTHYTNRSLVHAGGGNWGVNANETGAIATVTATSHNHGFTGTQASISTLQPYITLNYIIKATKETPTLATVINTSSTSTTNAYSSKYINDNYAPKSHANSGTTYGVGTGSNYGHCKTINNLTTSSYSDGNALSAYQGYVLSERNTYSTSEKAIGKWTDGKTLYRRVVTGNRSGSAETGINYSSWNVSTLVKVTVQCYNSNGQYFYPAPYYNSSTDNYRVYVNTNNKNIYMNCGNSYPGYSGKYVLIVEYTKTS